jgi:hypothetical protein
MVWCDESVITDLVPLDRMTRRWVLKRAWSHGNSASVLRVRLSGGGVRAALARVASVIAGVARIVAGALRWAFGMLSRSLRHQARGARAVWRGGGMVQGAAGVVYQEYARNETAA